MFIGAALAIGAALTLGCRDTPSVPPRPAPEVTVATPAVETVTEFLYYDGTVEAIETAQIRARVPGYLEAVNFDESTDVKKGDVLFRIEPATFQVAVQQASASLARAKAEAELARTRRDRVVAAFDRNAANEIERLEAEAQLAVADAAVDQAQAGVDEANLQLSYTQVRSPIDGRVDRNYVDVGNLVGDGERTLLATVVRMDRVRVTFDASERIVLRYIARGDAGDVGRDGITPPPVDIGRLGDEGYPFAGTIDYVGNVVDPSTGTLVVRAVLDNPDTRLFPGLYARIRVPFQENDGAVLVDENAVQTDLAGRFVYVVGEENLVERRGVEVGSRYDGRLHIVSGLIGDERYIVNGLQRARPGLPVRPTMVGDEGAAAADGDAANAAASADRVAGPAGPAGPADPTDPIATDPAATAPTAPAATAPAASSDDSNS
ncbi:MAG: efflux RND transporter periplasmic adaptor subunit [Phycisphaerales bacterium]